MYHLKTFIIFMLYLSAFYLQTNSDYPKKMIVNVAVADLRSCPEANDAHTTLPASDLTNPFQITQLLLNEHVMVNEEFIDSNNQAWFQVHTLQQQYYHLPIGWHGYPGWIQADQLTQVENFASHNLVVNKKLAHIFDSNDQSILRLSIGTRLKGIEKIKNNWKVVLPDHTMAYIHESDVFFINPIIRDSIQQLRQKIIQTALMFIDDFYSWGGRSAQNNAWPISSVDCSALINLSFLAHGLQIPRMSHEQFLKSYKINYCNDLQPCDLIFFSSITKKSIRMDHVMLYLGDDQLLEATFADQSKVRIISLQDRLGKNFKTMAYGDVIDWNNEEFYVYFSSFFHGYTMIQKLRNDALQHNY